MANVKEINQYSSAGTIDPSTDLFLIDVGGTGVYNSINRNTTLGLSSAPLGTTDSQSPQNKTFDNTNALTIKDGSLTIQNSSSVTKQAVFSAASITAGQTRTFTFPDASGTLATIAGTQTFTNKTITSPAITGGTYDNGTITVDAISGHTSSTIVTVANLQISNGVLNSANSVTSTAVAAGAIQPQALQSGTGSGWSWQSFTPTLANLTKGNGSVTANYIQIGKTVFVRMVVVLGSTSSVGTGPTFTYPVTPSSSYTQSGVVFNVGWASLISGASEYMAFVIMDNTSTFRFAVLGTASTYLGGLSGLTASVPGSWGANDSMLCQFYYEAA